MPPKMSIRCLAWLWPVRSKPTIQSRPRKFWIRWASNIARTARQILGCDAQKLKYKEAITMTHTLHREGSLDDLNEDFIVPVSYTHLRAHETDSYLVCRLLLEKKKK